MRKSKVDRKVAAQEVGQWLDYRKISERKRAKNPEILEANIDSVEDGFLCFDHTKKEAIYTLNHPIEDKNGAVIHDKLTLKSRINMSEYNQAFNSFSKSTEEGIARTLAYISASTGISVNLLILLESSDFNDLQNLVFYFL